MSEAQKVIAAFRAAGFAVEHTGGNCDCLRRNEPDGTVTVITMEEDPAVPESFDELCFVGTFARQNWEEETGNDPLSQDYATTRDLLARYL